MSTKAAAKEACFACGKDSCHLKRCSACKVAWYCDVICQRLHFATHEPQCKRLQKEAVKAAQVNEQQEKRIRMKCPDTCKGQHAEYRVQYAPGCWIPAGHGAINATPWHGDPPMNAGVSPMKQPLESHGLTICYANMPKEEWFNG